MSVPRAYVEPAPKDRDEAQDPTGSLRTLAVALRAMAPVERPHKHGGTPTSVCWSYRRGCAMLRAAEVLEDMAGECT